MLKHLKNKKGFTLIQIVMGLVVGGMIAGVTSEILFSQAESFSYMTNKKEAIADVRFAINRISNELMRIQNTTDITGATSLGVSFNDVNGTPVTYALGNDAATGTLALTRNDKIVVSNIQTVDFGYYDANGNSVSNPNSNLSLIKRIKVTLKTDTVNSTPGVTMTTAITPRVFIGYNNFQ